MWVSEEDTRFEYCWTKFHPTRFFWAWGNTWYLVYGFIRELYICNIVKVIKYVPQIWTKPTQTCHFVGHNSGFPGTQLILNLAI